METEQVKDLEATNIKQELKDENKLNLPWRGNDIYLEDCTKAVKAVCSSAEIAKTLASCMELYSSLNSFKESKTKLYGKFIQDAYYLYVAMSNAKIPVNSIETSFVEKAFSQFCISLNEILKHEKLEFKDSAKAIAPSSQMSCN